jgi:uncharacterized protein with PQ loop repeat
MEKRLMAKVWNDPIFMKRAPIVATILLEYANVGQLIRMWTYKTAAGQSLTAWFAVFLALCCYNQFYRIVTPEQIWARRMSFVGILMNSAVCLTVLYFRLTGRG